MLRMNPETMMEMLRQQLPGLKTQGQMTAFLAAQEAFFATVAAALRGDHVGYNLATGALNLGLKAVQQATELATKFEDVPPGERSEAAAEFMANPVAAQVTEYDQARALMSELERVKTTEELGVWYNGNRHRLEGVKDPTLRNNLFDMIRNRRGELSGVQP